MALGLAYASSRIGIKDTSQPLKPKDDSWWKGKYYLDCCNSRGVPPVQIPAFYRDKDHDSTPTVAQCTEMYSLLYYNSPERMEKRLGFIEVPEGVKLNAQNNSNVFIEITETTDLTALGITREALALLHSSEKTELRIMLYHPSWARQFYTPARQYAYKWADK
jgi:hypothetical protein